MLTFVQKKAVLFEIYELQTICTLTISIKIVQQPGCPNLSSSIQSFQTLTWEEHLQSASAQPDQEHLQHIVTSFVETYLGREVQHSFKNAWPSVHFSKDICNDFRLRYNGCVIIQPQKYLWISVVLHSSALTLNIEDTGVWLWPMTSSIVTLAWDCSGISSVQVWDDQSGVSSAVVSLIVTGDPGFSEQWVVVTVPGDTGEVSRVTWHQLTLEQQLSIWIILWHSVRCDQHSHTRRIWNIEM